MQDVREVFHNQVLVTALIACFLAQFLKLFFEGIRQQRLNFHVLIETGGMPSSHSALVSALAAGVGQAIGWASTEFAVATIFAIIVMYDASGIRRAAGQQARVLNQMLADSSNATQATPLNPEARNQTASSGTDQPLSRDPNLTLKPALATPLKEMLGHTPIEVLVGSVIGVAVSVVAGATSWTVG